VSYTIAVEGDQVIINGSVLRRTIAVEGDQVMKMAQCCVVWSHVVYYAIAAEEDERRSVLCRARSLRKL
jgi:hypothetical protein